MIQFITTYFMDESAHLNTFYWRPTGELQQFWTLPYIPRQAMPKGRAINPISKTNWEGTGITPDYQVASSAALDSALEIAYDSLMQKSEAPEMKFAYKWQLEGLKAKTNPTVIAESVLKKYAGIYEVRAITFENGDLYYQREGRPKYKMIPMNETTFLFDELKYFRLKVIMENGQAVALEGQYDNSRTDKSLRTK